MIEQNSSVHELNVAPTKSVGMRPPPDKADVASNAFPAPQPLPDGHRKSLQIGDRIVCPIQRTIMGPHGSCQIEPKALAVLLVLTRFPGKLVSREQLLAECWGGFTGNSEKLTRTVSSLRKHLGDSPRQPRFICTARNSGYALIAKVSEAPAVNEPRGSDDRVPEVAGIFLGGQPWLADMVRRRVFRVLGGYVLMSWVLLQVAEIVFPAVRIPEWGLSLLLVLLVLGFPLVAVLAWAVQVTERGLALDIPVRRMSSSSKHWGSGKLAATAALVLLVCGLGTAIAMLVNLDLVNTTIAGLAETPDASR